MAQTNVQAFSGDVEISSNLAVDTNTLFVDSVGSKVGVGTTNPSAKLQVGGNAETDPQYLWIRGNRLNEAGEICGIHFYNSASAGDRGNSRIINSRDGDNYGSELSFWTNPAANESATQKMVIDRDGNVGIGTTDPAKKLHVEHYGSQIGDFEGIRIANHATNLHATARPAYEFVVSDINSGTGIGNGKFAIGYRGSTSASRTDRLVIDTAGQVGIGTTIPYFTLDVRNVDNANPGVTARFIGGGSAGIRFVTGLGGTSNNWKSTGIGLSGTSGGGAVFFVFTMNNSNADNSSAAFYFIRKPYDQAYWAGSAFKIFGTNGGGSSETVYFTNSGGILYYRVPNQGNGYFYAIEFDS
jgi:hypothetical protein